MPMDEWDMEWFGIPVPSAFFRMLRQGACHTEMTESFLPTPCLEILILEVDSREASLFSLSSASSRVAARYRFLQTSACRKKYQWSMTYSPLSLMHL